MKRYLLTFLLFSLILKSYSQERMIDSSLNIPFLGISFGIHQPTGDLGDRFGNFLSIGGQFGFKMKNQVYLGLRAHYFFGENVKEDDILDNIKTSEGGVIEIGGELTQPIIDMQGYNISLVGGYLFPVFGPNPNSGILVAAGPSFLSHRISIDYRDAQIPQLEGDYIGGYDRLTNGWGLNEFVGYMYNGRKRLVSFYAGIDLTQTWTTSVRGYNYDEMRYDKDKRNDNMIGFRIGWMITMYKNAPDQFYYR